MGSGQRLGPAVSSMAPDAGKSMVRTDFFNTLVAGVASALFLQIFNFSEYFINGKP
jgi:hypothetical protein